MINAKLSHAALAAALLGAVAACSKQEPPKTAEDAPQERCWGVAKAGENDCAAADGSHGCHTEAKVSYSGQDYKLVPSGTCTKMKGKDMPFAGANPDIKDGAS